MIKSEVETRNGKKGVDLIIRVLNKIYTMNSVHYLLWS